MRFELQHHRESKGWRGLSPEFGVVRLYVERFVTGVRCAERFVTGVRGGSTVLNLLYLHHCRGNKVCRVLFYIYSVAGETRCAGCLCPSSGWFKHIEPLPDRASKVWRVLTHEFGEVRPYRNFSINRVKGETRRAGCLYTSSGWFSTSNLHEPLQRCR